MKMVNGNTPSFPGFLEFFAGSGLVAEGLKDFFTPLWANDNDPKKRAVYVENQGEKHFHLGSVTDVRGTTLPNASLAWASFPCQDLSLAGAMGGLDAARSGLVWEWLRVMDELPVRPQVLVAENVLGLVSADGGAHYRRLHEALRERGYRVGAMLLDAIHWLPHSRPRVFVVALRGDAVMPQRLISPSPSWAHPEVVSRVARGLDDFIFWAMPVPKGARAKLDDIVEWNAPGFDEESNARNLAIISPRHRKALNAMPQPRIAAPGYRRTRSGQQVLELRFDGVAGCLRTPEGGSSRQILVIREHGELRTRLLTVRETARLMGAPEEYRIPGSYNDGYKAMGDGVAAPVARYLAKHLLRPLVDANNEKSMDRTTAKRIFDGAEDRHPRRARGVPGADASSDKRRITA